ncbi:MAG: hypothetical protein KBC12_00880 [Candidatus Pacebacteria bacterium]|nr:hypothetical protein [Candidatus Paceibacterota bacterium]
MKQIESKIRNSGLVASLNGNQALRVNLLRAILAGFGLFALLYLFLLGSSVLNIVERKTLETEARTISNEIGALELNYLQVSSSIDRELSSSMGFEEISQNFATRKSVALISKKLAKNEIGF